MKPIEVEGSTYVNRPNIEYHLKRLLRIIYREVFTSELATSSNHNAARSVSGNEPGVGEAIRHIRDEDNYFDERSNVDDLVALFHLHDLTRVLIWGLGGLRTVLHVR